MKTKTIFSAWCRAALGSAYGLERTLRLVRQCDTFRAELDRRMDAGDKWRTTFPCHTPDQTAAALAIHTATAGILEQRKVMK